MSWLTRDPVEELRQVDVHHDMAALLGVTLRSQHGVVGPTARAEAVAVLAEGGINQRLQHLQQCLLNQTISDGGDAQFPLTAVRLRDAYPTDGLWLVGAAQQVLAKLRPRPSQVFRGLGNVQPVHTCRSLVGLHALPCPLHILSCERLLKQASPCAFRFLSRESCFIAHRLRQGFTCPLRDPPRWRGHLMPYSAHRQGV